MTLSQGVTDGGTADTAVQRAEERLRLIQEATDLAEFEASAEGISHFSERFLAQVGLPSGTTSLSHDEWLQLVHADDRERFRHEIQRSLQAGDCFQFEFRITRVDTGEVRWISSRTKPICNETGAVVRRTGAHLDITDLKRAEEALKASEARLSAMLRAMPDCVKIFDEQANIAYINPRGLELLEAPDLGTLEASGHVPIPSEYLAAGMDVHARVLAGESIVWCYEIIGMRGSRRHVEAHAVPFTLPNGARAHMCISRDISERKLAEDALRRSEEVLRLAHDAAGLAEFETSPVGITTHSSLFFEQVGLPPRDGLMTFDEWLENVHPDDRERFSTEVRQAMTMRDGIVTEFRIVRADTGEVRWLQSHNTVMRDASGASIRGIGAHFDITDRKRAEEALRESEERFRLAAKAAGIGIWDYDAVLDKREWSDRLREIFGISCHAPALLESAVQCIHSDDRDTFLDHLGRIKSDATDRFEVSVRIKRADDGRERWVSINGWCTHKADAAQRRIIITARDVTEEKTAEERIRWNASHDPLTRLANRTMFQEKLEQAIRSSKKSGKAAGVLMLDLDHFKQVNDSLGHDVGDALLKMFADRLRLVVRTRDTVARLGGDEFAIIVSQAQDENDLVRLAHSIQERMLAPFIHGGRILDCRASMGASLFPAHGNSARDLLKNADIALYAAKAAGRSTLTIYDARLREDMQCRLAMVHLARNAIADDRVIPYYQPKLDLDNGLIDGFEALLRWRTPNGRIGHPGALEAAFEDMEVAAAISDRMIERVIADMRGWLDRGIAFNHVAVNASAAEFRRDNFAERVLDRLARARIPTRCFQIEITETVFLGRGAEYVRRALALLNQQGVKIALDDFGTGYASLRHLKQFPVDLIKIDQSFVRDMEIDPGDEAIVRAVINLGKSLGIGVVAEGIESAAQAERLQRLGCNFGQGFLFSKAIAPGRVPALVGRFPAAAPAGLPKKEQLRLVAGRAS